MLDLHVEGPFEIPVQINNRIKRIGKNEIDEFWNASEVTLLEKKQGCYIFALRAGQGCTPWYVGKAGTGKRGEGFRKEVFTPRNVEMYNDVMFNNTHGTPVMYFVTRRTRVIPNPVIKDVETTLIRYGFVKNNGIKNTQHANTPRWSIRSVIRGGAGQPSLEARKFKRMMGI